MSERFLAKTEQVVETERVGFMLEGWYVFDNYAPFQIDWHGQLWPTTEHAYQAAHFFTTNPELAEQVRLQRSPRLADDFANAHSDQDDPNWKSKRLEIMEQICRAKLEQHELVKDTLLKTGNRPIFETNDSDSFWGWGADHNGENHLGKIWMKLREELIASND